ncbi:MAG TPA: UvrD-helicase domain-containing protein [Methylophilus sp.]
MNQSDLLIEDALSREQALALDSFIVEAPAGAGKTELLTQRYLKLLQTVDAPEEIIAITFTNKAASEMKARIMDSLDMAAAGVLSSQPHKQTTYHLGLAVLARSAQLAWNVLATPSRLRIYTIDSLSANLARQMPLLSRFGTQPKVCDDASAYYQEAATRALEYLDDATHGPVVEAALRYFDNDTYKLTQLLADMLAKREQWLPYSQSQHTAQDAEAALAAMIQVDIQAAAKILNRATQTALMPIARYAASNLTEDSAIASLIDWDSVITATPERLTQWCAVSTLLMTNSGTLRKSLNKNMGLPATDEAKPYKAALTEIIDGLNQIANAEASLARLQLLPNPQQEADTWQMIDTLAKVLHIAVAELWLVFQTHGEVDFVEISQRALQALVGAEDAPTDLALKLDYRIRHLLVDEFQDTSPTQIKLIHALTRGWQPEDGRTLFCVGDPMQSIYRFRKANVGLFLRVAQQGISDVMLQPLKLWRNNRSCPPVVDWINQAFAQVFPAQDSISQGAIQYRPFVATKSSADNAGVTVHAMLHSANEESEEDASEVLTDVRQQEADRIIQIIQQTRATAPQANIAVLVRARSHLEALVREIRRNHPDLSFQAVEIEELANRQIVQDLLSLSYALHQRADRVHWLAILRAPWCGLTLADLHALVGLDKHSTVMQLMHNEARLQHLSEGGRARLLHVRTVLTQALQHQGRMNTSRWLHGVWLMLGGAECLWDAGDVRDVQAFFERVQQLELSGQFSPELLALEVQKLYAAPDVKADDSLQFMTIHKSKGLEFDTVILPGLDRKTSGHDQALLLWEEVPIDDTESTDETRLIVAPYLPKSQKNQSVSAYDYLKMLENERAAYEDARVLYVAATRAERCLHLLGAAKIDTKTGLAKAPKSTFLEMLWPMLHHAFTPEQMIPAPNNLTPNHSLTLDQFVPQLVRLAQPRIPSALDYTQAEFKPDNPQTSNNTKDNAASLEADIGTLAHVYLQLIAESNMDDWPSARVHALQNVMQRWFSQRGYDATQSMQAANRVVTLLNSTLASEQGRWVLKNRTTAASELAIEFQAPQAITKKIIDRTFVEDGVRWIIDYKSAALIADMDAPALKQFAAQFKPQLDAYAVLFKQEGLPIKTAVLLLSVGQLVEI